MAMHNVILRDRVSGDKTVPVNNIYCIGRNYVDHVAELKNEMPEELVVFMKPNNSLLPSGGTIHLPAYSQSVHYECELLLLIGRDSDAASIENPLDCVAAYGVGLDLTARDVQIRLKEKGLPWTKAKGFRGAACVSDFVPARQISDPQNCEFTLHINGELRQHGRCMHMIHSLPDILRELADTYGLCAGDVVFTGTPAGVGLLHAGDRLLLDLAGQVQATFNVC
ncbi:MAG: fumarylacetoacetate hydrolase family protein [Brachymonas sp.]|nr:fumarylacetoacetate hydrolase family protein [Brachymonas sp.]